MDKSLEESLSKLFTLGALVVIYLSVFLFLLVSSACLCQRKFRGRPYRVVIRMQRAEREHPVAKTCGDFCGIRNRRYIFSTISTWRFFSPKSSFTRESEIIITTWYSWQIVTRCVGFSKKLAKFSFMRKVWCSRVRQWYMKKNMRMH